MQGEKSRFSKQTELCRSPYTIRTSPKGAVRYEPSIFFIDSFPAIMRHSPGCMQWMVLR
jgi:hypothetical protein